MTSLIKIYLATSIKKIILAIPLLFSILLVKAQVPPPTFTCSSMTATSSISTGTLTTSDDVNVAGNLNVSGPSTFNSSVSIVTKLAIGSGTDAVAMKYVSATPTFPAMAKFSPQSGAGPIGGPIGGGVDPDDSTPNLSCLNGVPLPGFLNTFSQMLSVTYNPVTPAPTNPGGQILMGHNGLKAILETQTSNFPGAINHTGDLFINSFCNRNVYLFGPQSFALGSTKVMSVAGKVNVTDMIQLGSTSNSFEQNDCRLFVRAVASPVTGIKIMHGGQGSSSAVRVIELTDNDKAFAVIRGTQFAEIEEKFSIQGDGKTIIGGQPGSLNNATLNINVNGGEAVNVYDQATNKVNFAVLSDGRTHIGAKRPLPGGIHNNAMLSVDGKVLAREIYVNISNNVWPDYVFAKKYKLAPLNEVKVFIEKEKHLPGVPTAKELEENGLSIADIQSIQMEKTEELFLYNIKINDDFQNLKAEFLEMKKEIKRLQEENKELKRIK
jgi:hypothetical protein